MTTPAPVFSALSRPLVLAAALAAAAMLGVKIAHSESPAPAPAAAPTSVAVLNLEKLFDNLNELKDSNAVLKTERDGYIAQLTEMDNKTKALEAELKEKIPASERQKRAEKAAELTEAKAVLKVRTELLDGTMERKNVEVIRALYDKTAKAVADFAAKEGYDIVMLDDRSLTLPESTSMNNLNSVILSKRILFAKDATDVTDRLISQMNAEYSAAPRPGR